MTKSGNENWTTEQAREFFRTGKAPVSASKGDPCERTVTEVTTGRHHRKLVKRADVGVTFASLTEERRFDYLMGLPEVVHVDIHPVLSLPHGIRYHADFLVHRMKWQADKEFWTGVRIEDVKSKRSMTTDFRRLKKIVDDSHPFGPLFVVRWINKQWKVTT